MSLKSGRAILGLSAVGVLTGIALGSILRGYLIAPSRIQFSIFAVLLIALFVCISFLRGVPARIMQFLTSCALGILFVAAAAGR